jgi:hypothetical protein
MINNAQDLLICFHRGNKSPVATMYNKTFTPLSNTSNGEVSSATLFHYHQKDHIVWAKYNDGSIVKGSLIATVQDKDGTLDKRYQHVNTKGELMTGCCESRLERLEDGRLRMHEKWQWTSGDCSKGGSVVEEVKKEQVE